MCELFLPFNKSLIVLVTTNLELARENPERWAAWLQTLRRLSADRRTLIAANSAYDAAYVRHFAQVVPELLPSLAAYVEPSYAPRADSPQFLIAPAHSDAARVFVSAVRSELAREASQSGTDTRSTGRSGGAARGVQLAWLRELYSEYEFEQLASHPAVLLLPYTKSVMTFFELYRMAVPLYAPSLDVRANCEPRGARIRANGQAARRI
jgi:hypothetical protein